MLDQLGSYSQARLRGATWMQTSSGLILPVSEVDEKKEEQQEQKWELNSSGLFLPVSVPPEQPYKPTSISLFTGAGGFDLGFHQANWRIVAASDHDVSCCWTYCYNLGTRPIQMHFITDEDRDRFLKLVVKQSQRKPKNGAFWNLVEMDELDRATFHRQDQGPIEIEDATPHYFLGDVRKLTGRMILEAVDMQKGEPDCITGGPPCQGFSNAGRREVMDPRNSLIFEFARLILEISPKTFVFENVPGIVSMVTPEGIPVLDAFCHMLSDGGYASYEGLKQGIEHNLNAWGVIRDQGGSKAQLTKNSNGVSEHEAENEEMMQLHLFGE